MDHALLILVFLIGVALLFDFLKSIELLGTKVKPLVDAALAGNAGAQLETA